jgi:uncharacterized protein (TIGR03792 family)
LSGLPPASLFDLSVRHAGSHGPGSGAAVEIVEHLRVKVPAGAQEAWLAAEQRTWEPWLEAQPGFLGRDLLWDSAREEGILLIHWASREQWQSIPTEEVERVQARFEACARQVLHGWGGDANPFPMLFAGEQPASVPLHPSRADG